MLRAIRLEGSAAVMGGRELCGPGAPLWIDCTPAPEHLAFLGERFGFHPLALEDCAHEDQRTKVEEYPESVFAVFHRLEPSADESAIQSREVHAFLGADFLVTVHSAPVAEVDRLFDRCAAGGALLGRGADYVLYQLCDGVTDIHAAVVDALADEVEELLAEVLTTSPRDEQDLLERVQHVRRMLVHFRRRLSPQREIFAALVRQEIGRVRPANAPYFRDVLDHLMRVTEEIETARDLLASAMDVHFSTSNNRLAQTTTRLTLVATIFLPLNFVAGFFGMNLEILPPAIAVPIVLAAMVALPLAMWRLFRKRGLL